MGPDGDPGRLLDRLSDCLSGDFDIDHSTFQLEALERVLWERPSGAGPAVTAPATPVTRAALRSRRPRADQPS
jgi:hypothetical protein